MNTAYFQKLNGRAYRDPDGHRWSVKGERPGPGGQFVIEEEIPGSYPRVAVHTMTAGEFREHARNSHLRPEQPRARRGRAAATHPR